MLKSQLNRALPEAASHLERTATINRSDPLCCSGVKSIRKSDNPQYAKERARDKIRSCDDLTSICPKQFSTSMVLTGSEYAGNCCYGRGAEIIGNVRSAEYEVN